MAIWLQRLWYRMFFGWDERRRAFGAIVDLLGSGFSESEIYSLLSTNGYSDEVKALARTALAGKDLTGLFCSQWGVVMVPLKEALLLEMGERNGNFQEMVKIISGLRTSGLTFLSAVVAKLAQMVLSLAMLLGLLVYFGTQASRFARSSNDGSQPAFVEAGLFISAWWPVALGVAVGLAAVYYLSEWRLPKAARRAAYRVELFVVRDRKFAAEALDLVHALMRAGSSHAQALLFLRGVYRRGFRRRMVLEAIERVDDGYPLGVAFQDNVLERSHANFLQSVSPLGDSESMMKALPMVSSLIKEYTHNSLRRQFYIWGTVFGIPTAWATWSLLPLITGAGLTG